MKHAYTISGLRRKRALLAGEIEAAERDLARQRETLAALDMTLRLFHPEADPSHITSIRPVVRDANFRHGEKARLVREALRDAEKPLSTRMVTEYVMRAKGMDRDDKAIWATAREHVRKALLRMVARGTVRRVVSEPEAWWDLG